MIVVLLCAIAMVVGCVYAEEILRVEVDGSNELEKDAVEGDIVLKADEDVNDISGGIVEAVNSPGR